MVISCWIRHLGCYSQWCTLTHSHRSPRFHRRQMHRRVSHREGIDRGRTQPVRTPVSPPLPFKSPTNLVQAGAHFYCAEGGEDGRVRAALRTYPTPNASVTSALGRQSSGHSLPPISVSLVVNLWTDHPSDLNHRIAHLPFPTRPYRP